MGYDNPPCTPPHFSPTMIFRSPEVSHWRKNMFPEKKIARNYRTRAIFIPYGTEIANFRIFLFFLFPSQEFYYKRLNMYKYGTKWKLRVLPFRQVHNIHALWLWNFHSSKNSTPTPKKIKKKTIFGRKIRIIYYFKLYYDCFYIKCVRCISYNKTSTNKWPLLEFYDEKAWKMGNFQFCRFSLENTHISIFLANHLNHHLYSG